MPKAPTTYEDLRTDIALTDRVALTVAAVLPNLPETESLIVLRGHNVTASGKPVDRRFETDRDTIDDFKRYHEPVCPNSDVYRVKVDGDEAPGYNAEVTPVPHPRRSYHIVGWDFTELVSLDPDEYAFEDTDQSTLTDFGVECPYFSPAYKLAGEYARKPRLPV